MRHFRHLSPRLEKSDRAGASCEWTGPPRGTASRGRGGIASAVAPPQAEPAASERARRGARTGGSAAAACADGRHLEGEARTGCVRSPSRCNPMASFTGRSTRRVRTITHRKRRIQRQRARLVPEGRAAIDRQDHPKRREQIRVRSHRFGQQGAGVDVHEVKSDRDADLRKEGCEVLRFVGDLRDTQGDEVLTA